MTNVLLAIVATMIIVIFGEVDWGFEATICYLAMILTLNTYDIKKALENKQDHPPLSSQ